MNTTTLKCVLSKMLGKTVTRADYTTTSLQGGTIGDVQLVSGIAETDSGEKLPYKVVFKTQEKREIPGESFCREYELFKSDFGTIFSDKLRWAEYYHFEIGDKSEKNIQIWMEYIEGLTGENLTTEMLEYIAEELGRFQGRLYKNPGILSSIDALDIGELMERYYSQWNPETAEYKYIRSKDCEIPSHLTQMLIDMDNNFTEIYDNIKKLPRVLCHSDFWINNIFYVNGTVILIDWDYTSWGYMGEDIANLIADDIKDMKYLDEYYNIFIPAYYKGISKYFDISAIDNNYIWEMMLIKFGYRFIHRYIFADPIESAEYKNQQITALQKIYDIKN